LQFDFALPLFALYVLSRKAIGLLLSEIVVTVVVSMIMLDEPVTVFSTIGARFIIIATTLVSVKDEN